MARHKRARIPWWNLRASYRALWLQYQALHRDYEALSADHDLLLSPPPEEGRQTSWGRANEDILETQAIPVITDLAPEPGLDPDKAQALVRRTGLLVSPGGWESADRGTTD